MDNLSELTILVKVSELCPLDCIYCYAGDGSPRKMDDITLQNMYRVIDSRPEARRTHYIWHGKEPLTMGLEFYKRALEFQKPYAEKHRIINSMQSNGVLITPEIADFFVDNQIDIGFSLDGPKYVHDNTRYYMGGGGSFDDVMRGINLMKERKKNAGVIAVLTKYSLPYLDEIYDFFKSENISFKLNPLIDCGNAKGKEVQISLTLDEKVDAVCHMFDRWFFDEDTQVGYDNMVSIIRGIFLKSGSACDMQETCQDSFLGVGADGTVYPCGRFSDKAYSYGNVNELEDIHPVLNHPLRQQLLNRFESIKGCQPCQYKQMCYGGCMHNAYVNGDIFGKDPNCASTQLIIEYISRRILEQLEKDNAINLEQQELVLNG